jgi:hypothetical protein
VFASGDETRRQSVYYFEIIWEIVVQGESITSLLPPQTQNSSRLHTIHKINSMAEQFDMCPN